MASEHHLTSPTRRGGPQGAPVMKPAYGLGAAIALATIFAVNIMLAGGGEAQRLAAFISTTAALILLLSFIGREIKQRPAGIIIDNRNRISLSKLQATAWTVLIVAGLITAAAIRIHAGVANPLDIGIGEPLLIVMGISATSLVATPAILSLKTNELPKPEEVAEAQRVGAVAAEGKVHGRPEADQASWADIFRGDELSNAATPDLSKIQQFLITALLLTYYAILLGDLCWDGTDVLSNGNLPPFSQGIVWLLGISHASYLGYKAAPHSGSQAATTVRAAAGARSASSRSFRGMAPATTFRSLFTEGDAEVIVVGEAKEITGVQVSLSEKPADRFTDLSDMRRLAERVQDRVLKEFGWWVELATAEQNDQLEKLLSTTYRAVARWTFEQVQAAGKPASALRSMGE